MKVIQPKLKLQTKLLYILPVLAVVIMLFLATGVYLKTTVSPTHAEVDRITGSSGATITAAADRDLTVTIHNSEIVLDLTPSQQGVFRYNDFATNPLTVEVATNNPTGYNLNMTATTTDLIRTAPLSGQTPVIHTLSSGSFTSDTFETNAWGFTMDGTTYQPVTLSRQINQTIKESNSSTTSLAFGVKLNDEIPSGNYKATLTFIATTNPLESNFDTAFDAAGKTQVSYNGNNYYKMQDMSGFICSMVATPTDKTSAESTQLIDTRDNSVYWVSKLLDGNCWMTQNLDLNLDSSVALTSANTDLHSVTSWTPTRSTIDSTGYGNITTCSSQNNASTGCWGQTNTGFASGWTNDNDTPYSDNPGYRYMTFTDRTATNPAWYSNGDTFANCSTQDTNCGGQGHYMIGNYYNFAAANATNSVASTVGHTVINSDADYVMPNSICPKGWRMPLGQSSNNDFTTLMTAYDIYGTNAMTFNYQGLNAVRRAPLYFVRSGNVNGGTLLNAGTTSYVWSSTISAEAYGRDLCINGTNVSPANSDNRPDGFTVRCLARTDLTIEDATYLQDVTPEMRQNTAIGTTATVLDKRDNEEYTIGKLADGNIWLLDNLRLGASPIVDPISSSNTNIDSTVSFTLPTIVQGSTYYPSATYDHANEVDNNGWKSGVFYNYIAVTAGTRSNGLGNLTTDSTMDICPSGWKIPNVRSNQGGNLIYDNIRSIYGSDENIINALHISTSIGYIGETGYIATTGSSRIWGGVANYSSGNDEVRAYGIGVKSASASGEVYNSNGVAAHQPVRCLLK